MKARPGADFSRVPVHADSADKDILALQSSIGNAAVSRMLEQAGRQQGAGGGHQQTAPAPVQRSAVHDVLSGSGQPLAAPIKEEMEARLGADFSHVRVHAGDAASASAAEVGARAYTSGDHVVIGNGGADKQTLAHELTHVIQQCQGPVAGTDHGNGLKVSDPSDAYEKAAEAHAARVMRAPLGQHHVALSQKSASRARPERPAGDVVQRRLGLQDAVAIMHDADQRLTELSDHAALREYWLHNVHRQLVLDFHDLDTAQKALAEWFQTIAGHHQDVEYITRAWKEIVAGYSSIAPKPNRPAANPRNLKLNARTEAMEKAQEVNDKDKLLFEHNVETLQHNRSAVFYVVGKSAMGQGDTAFIVRTVNLLKGLGLAAVGVKAEQSAHDPGTSFKTSLGFITPDALYRVAKPGDFVIEGPLSDPTTSRNPEQSTWLDTVAGKFQDEAGKFRDVAKDIRNLRLYEYGTLSYRGGQQMQQHTAANVVKYAGDPRHAFMGMGHGEIGAFYNADAGKETPPLQQALEEHAENNATVKQIQTVLGKHEDATIFIGYANSSEIAYTWASAVQKAVGGKQSSGHSLIVAVYGGKQTQPKFAIDDSVNITWIIDREKGPAERAAHPFHITNKATSSIIVTDSVPAPVMNALQLRASPFTLATGNYSLSEAIEHGQLASYETLNVNAGVEADYKWQLQNAMEHLQVDEKLQGAVMVLVSPAGLKNRANEIQLVLQHPDEIKQIMTELRANTDIKKLLVSRLAALESAALESAATNAHH
jgi:hypothetical protein